MYDQENFSTNTSKLLHYFNLCKWVDSLGDLKEHFFRKSFFSSVKMGICQVFFYSKAWSLPKQKLLYITQNQTSEAGEHVRSFVGYKMSKLGQDH